MAGGSCSVGEDGWSKRLGRRGEVVWLGAVKKRLGRGFAVGSVCGRRLGHSEAGWHGGCVDRPVVSSGGVGFVGNEWRIIGNEK